jgi:hypothetical protein
MVHLLDVWEAPETGQQKPRHDGGVFGSVIAKDLIARADLKSPNGDLFSKRSLRTKS